MFLLIEAEAGQCSPIVERALLARQASSNPSCPPATTRLCFLFCGLIVVATRLLICSSHGMLPLPPSSLHLPPSCVRKAFGFHRGRPGPERIPSGEQLVAGRCGGDRCRRRGGRRRHAAEQYAAGEAQPGAWGILRREGFFSFVLSWQLVLYALALRPVGAERA